ncbi:hypothetical protein XAB3213_4250016 [Xanthomonas citri pv. bilvae]|nr:hypothetical protein XAB3213_4250016 [Xanthomonas citri pv. bilvae]
MRCTSSAMHHRRPPTGKARGQRDRHTGAHVRAEVSTAGTTALLGVGLPWVGTPRQRTFLPVRIADSR